LLTQHQLVVAALATKIAAGRAEPVIHSLHGLATGRLIRTEVERGGAGAANLDLGAGDEIQVIHAIFVILIDGVNGDRRVGAAGLRGGRVGGVEDDAVVAPAVRDLAGLVGQVELAPRLSLANSVAVVVRR